VVKDSETSMPMIGYSQVGKWDIIRVRKSEGLGNVLNIDFVTCRPRVSLIIYAKSSDFASLFLFKCRVEGIDAADRKRLGLGI